MWLCKQCSGQVPENERVTHEDFHLAMQLSREQSGALPLHDQRHHSAMQWASNAERALLQAPFICCHSRQGAVLAGRAPVKL